MTIYSIYRVTNRTNGKVYIGYSSNVQRRFCEHRNAHRYFKNKFYAAILKYGIEQFDFEEIYCSKDKQHTLMEMEPFFIKEYNSFEDGYNSTCGGDAPPVWTKERRATHSKILSSLHANSDSIYNSKEFRKKKSQISSSLWAKVDSVFKTEEYKAKRRQKRKTFTSPNREYGAFWYVLTPDKECLMIKNLSSFCHANNLSYQAMKFKKDEHRGFKCIRAKGVSLEEAREILNNKRVTPEIRMRAHSHKWLIIEPDGNPVEVDILSLYCKEKGLSVSNLNTSSQAIKKGVGTTHHKGYRAYDITDMSQEKIEEIKRSATPFVKTETRARTYIVTKPNGETEKVFNLTKFCKENGLVYCRMARLMIEGTDRKQYKGYSVKKES